MGTAVALLCVLLVSPVRFYDRIFNGAAVMFCRAGVCRHLWSITETRTSSSAGRARCLHSRKRMGRWITAGCFTATAVC